MRSWFGPNRRVVKTVDETAPVDAYREGRRDERARLEDDSRDVRPARGDLDAAYEKGRADGHRRHRGSPLIALLVAVLAICGAAVIFLAIRDGSFSKAGAEVDNTLSTGADQAGAPLRGAAATTGQALQNAGQNLKQDAGATSQ